MTVETLSTQVPKRRLPMAPIPPHPRPSLQSTYVVYRGPSRLDPSTTIVGVMTGVTGGSVNRKTGRMAQLWILLDSTPPADAQRTGSDAAICGSCPMRPLTWRESGKRGYRCYVSMFRGTYPAWAASQGLTTDLAGALRALRYHGFPLRLGAYGDPAALPEFVIAALVGAASGHTAYTHQNAPELARWAMRSVETPWAGVAARLQGWRTFRVLKHGEAPMKGEILCPYEGGGIQCAKCGLCNGTGPAKSIAIHAH